MTSWNMQNLFLISSVHMRCIFVLFIFSY
uniref:Uncharacterized protein n=1 Tax=Rhizophora mucronata TaxID=61149 RepID=A0A2P2KVC5_RHIMU